MPKIFPIKVKEVVLTSNEYEQAVDNMKKLEDLNGKLENVFIKLREAGLLLPDNTLECTEFQIMFDEPTRMTVVTGR